MCLITDKKPQVAEQDIEVYKILTRRLRSIYHEFEYRINEIYTTELRTTVDDDDIMTYCEIDAKYLMKHFPRFISRIIEGELQCYTAGYHTISTLTMATEIQKRTCAKSVIVKCIIPKGSIFVEDFVGFMVSNAIIVKEII